MAGAASLGQISVLTDTCYHTGFEYIKTTALSSPASSHHHKYYSDQHHVLAHLSLLHLLHPLLLHHVQQQQGVFEGVWVLMVLRDGIVHDDFDALHVEVGVEGSPIPVFFIGVFVVLIFTDRLEGDNHSIKTSN